MKAKHLLALATLVAVLPLGAATRAEADQKRSHFGGLCQIGDPGAGAPGSFRYVVQKPDRGVTNLTNVPVDVVCPVVHSSTQYQGFEVDLINRSRSNIMGCTVRLLNTSGGIIHEEYQQATVIGAQTLRFTAKAGLFPAGNVYPTSYHWTAALQCILPAYLPSEGQNFISGYRILTN